MQYPQWADPHVLREWETLWGLSAEYLKEGHKTKKGGRSSNILVPVEAGGPEGVVSGQAVGNMTDAVGNMTGEEKCPVPNSAEVTDGLVCTAPYPFLPLHHFRPAESGLSMCL